MDRPYIFCHMLVSLDGKIMGRYMDTPEGAAAGEVFDRIAFGSAPYYHHQGWLSGRVTTDDNFTLYRKPVLPTGASVPEGDWIAEGSGAPWYISIDPSGRLGWTEPAVDYGGLHASVLEVLTERAPMAYRAFLRSLGISYVIAGREALDAPLLLRKLARDLHLETVMLGGGGILNWSFLRQGLCDEVSFVVAPAADGSGKTPSVFAAKDGLSDDAPEAFELLEARACRGGVLWLRYRVKHAPRA